MNFNDLVINKRYSVRKFSKKIVSQEIIDDILQVFNHIPTACNRQSQRLLILNSDIMIEKMHQILKFHFDAKLYFIVMYDKRVSWKRKFDGLDIGYEDAVIAATHILLKVAELDLGTTYVGYFDKNLIKETFHIEDCFEIVTILPIGYKANDEISPFHNEKEPVSNKVFYNQVGQKNNESKC